MTRTEQAELFGSHSGPPGFVYQPGFLSAHEEAALLQAIGGLEFQEARYRDYTARRRIVMYQPAAAIPEFLRPLRARVAAWQGLDPDAIEHVLINEYRPGTPLGWHRDSPDYDRVAGVSLGTPCRIRFRPWPAKRGDTVLALELAPRSAYQLGGDVRWRWQHSIPAVKTLRYSVTFRTLAA